MFLNRVLTLGLAIYKKKKKKSITKAKDIAKEWIGVCEWTLPFLIILKNNI